MPMRPCLDCGRPTQGNRCTTCQSARNRERDQERGSATARGYGAEHRAEKERHRPVVDAGFAVCAEPICLENDRAIEPSTEWDLAHDRDRPGHYRGPAHARCNRAEGARFAAARAAAAKNPGV